MADSKISELNALTEAAAADEIAIVDDSASETKKITFDNLAGGASKTELGYVSGVTSAIQTQLDTKGTGDGTVDTSGAPVTNDFAKFTDANTIEGRSYSEVRSDLNVEDGADVTDAANVEAAGAVMESLADAKGDLLTASADNTIIKTSVGTNDQYLAADSTATGGVSWKDVPASSTPLTTKGDVLTRDSSADARLPVGADGQTLTADSGESLGVKWATPAGGGDMLKSVYDTDDSGTVDASESVIGRARKETAGTIAVGKVVYLSNYNVPGAFPQVELADASSAATMPAAGIVTSTITDAAAGTIVSAGAATGLDTSSWSVGDILYVSPTTGELTSTRPTGAAELVQEVGVVFRSDASEGMINVIPNGYSDASIDATDIADGTVTDTEFQYINTLSSNAQTQLDAKAPLADPTFTGEIGIGSVNVSETELGILEGATLTTTELNYVDGVTDAIQTQLDDKIENVEDDTSPKLGGNLDVTGTSLVTTSNGDITLAPNGTGIVKGELKTFMVQLLANDADQEVGTAIGGDFRISSRAITVKAVRAYVDTAGTTGTSTIDINEAGTSILSTKLTIDSAEKSSETAATPAVISDAAIAADAIITIDQDAIQTTAAKGLKIAIDYVIA